MKKIAILGPKNTYSDVAAKVYQNHQKTSYEIIYKKQVSDVIQAISDDTIGIIPIENTLEGYVQQHLDYMLENPNIWISSELRLQVSFACISHRPIKDVKTVYVQYAAKNQCLRFMATLDEQDVVITDSNTQSYERYLLDSNSAVIIPNHIYTPGMAPIEIENVTDELQNETRFFVIGNQNTIHKAHENYKMAMVFTPTIDRPGLLLSIIEAFANAQINLISIMSRPTKKAIGTYHFFIELECKRTQIEHIETILEGLSKHMNIRLLGVFIDQSIEI
jgi:prephenate dehydratase